MAEATSQRDRIEGYWKRLTGEKPSVAEYNLFVRVVPYLGADNPLSPLFVHMIRLTHKDIGIIETEILEKGPSALQQAREMIDEFNETLSLLHRIRMEVERLTLIHDEVTQIIRLHERREQLSEEEPKKNRKGQMGKTLAGHDQRTPIITGIVALILANFVSILIICYVQGVTLNLFGAVSTPAVQHNAPVPLMQSWSQPSRGLTPSEQAAEDAEDGR